MMSNDFSFEKSFKETSLLKIIATFIFLDVVAFSMLTGCARLQVPVRVSVHEACNIDPLVWKQIATPPQRDALLELRNDQNDDSIRKYFVTANAPRESWFENSDRNVLGCRYKQQESCGGGMVSTIIFSRQGVLWKAEPTMTKICSH
jgi:hypothetical protein